MFSPLVLSRVLVACGWRMRMEILIARARVGGALGACADAEAAQRALPVGAGVALLLISSVNA